MNDFTNIPRDDNTRVIFSSPFMWGSLKIVLEKWRWDGITAESIIFLTKDVKGVNDKALEADVRNGPLVKKNSQVTIRRGDEFTFVNFNFKG